MFVTLNARAACRHIATCASPETSFAKRRQSISSDVFNDLALAITLPSAVVSGRNPRKRPSGSFGKAAASWEGTKTV